MNTEIDVLVVDDERINLKLIEGILKGENLNLILASSGPDALARLEDRDFAVILLDVMMPEMDGFELAEKLRSLDATKSVPIIFITAISKEQRHVFRGYELGAVDYLFKPVEPEVLRGKVGVFSDLHRNKRTLEKTTRRLEKTIRDLEKSRAALEDSEHRYRMIADYNYDWESWLGPDGGVLYVSPSCQRISGYTAEMFLDDPDFFQRIVHSDDLPIWREFIRDTSVVGGEGIDFRIHHKNARLKWVSMVKNFITDEQGNPLGVRTSLRDVTNRKHMEDQIKHNALHDPLTGLPNQGLLMDRLARALARSKESGQHTAIVFINLDRFQVFNDHYGHLMGDKILVAVAARLSMAVRTVDTVARFGGDEFVILIEGMARKSDVTDFAKQVQTAFTDPIVLDGSKFNVTASMGLDASKSGNRNQDDLVNNAKLAMFKAKDSGKKRYVVYSPKMREGAVDVLAVENDLKRGLEGREIEAYFQPIVNLADGSLSGFEALARWIHPVRGMVSPGEFIPVAEDTGLIVDLGVQVLEDACSALNGWRKKYPDVDKLFMAVNISAKQFGESSLVRDVAAILKRSGLPPEHLKLEITETVVMLDAMESSNRLNLLKNLGVLLSIDDFGTGYSSMSYLQKFPVDQLKVDLSFVQRLEKGPENIEIVRAIINMAHSLRLRVVAEGIETERQRDLLYSLQCDYGQGYLYSKPLSRKEAEEFIKTSS